jgi:hypothetical protein
VEEELDGPGPLKKPRTASIQVRDRTIEIEPGLVKIN